jgi:hypothetical protein
VRCDQLLSENVDSLVMIVPLFMLLTGSPEARLILMGALGIIVDLKIAPKEHRLQRSQNRI